MSCFCGFRKYNSSSSKNIPHFRSAKRQMYLQKPVPTFTSFDCHPAKLGERAG
jgi:hypothetical protein